MNPTSNARKGEQIEPFTAQQRAGMLASFGVGCAAMVVAARGGAGSGAGAALVIPATMSALMLAMITGMAAQRRAGLGHRHAGLALGATLALLGIALGWIGWSMSHELPAWPAAIGAALVVALPAVILAVRIRRHADV